MDPLDVRIVRAMGIKPYQREPKPPDALKPSRIAEVVGVTAETVRARIAKMEEQGVIAGYQAVPNLDHLDLTGEAYYFRAPDDEAKDDLVEEVAATPGLLEIHDFLGRGLCVDLAYRDPSVLTDELARLSELTGDDTPQRFYEREMPPVGRELTNLDWRILRALRWDATRSLYEMADDVGVSGRTVKSRYERMAKEGSVFSAPIFNPSKVRGLFLFQLLFWLEPDRVKATLNALVKAYNGRHVFGYVPASEGLGHFDMLLFAESTEEVEQLRRRGAGTPGVDRAEAWLFRDYHDHSAWLDDELDARIEATAV